MVHRGLLILVLLAAAAAAPGAASAPKHPIEGTWAWVSGGGSVKITAGEPGTFAGTVVGKWQEACGELATPGFTAWRISGTGTSYTGTFAQFNSCKRAPVDGQATWTVKTQGGKQRLVFCMTKSGEPPGMVFDPPFCSELTALGGADAEAPVVKALPGTGVHATTVKLQYNVADDSGKAREELAVRKGGTVLLRHATKLHAVQKDLKFSGGFFTRWVAPDTAGTLTFCVRAWDAAGNASRESCAPLRIR